MDSRKKQSILRRFWRRISGKAISKHPEERDSNNALLPASEHIELPSLTHLSSFSSSVTSRSQIHQQPDHTKIDKVWRRASMPITQLESFRTSTDHKDHTGYPPSVIGSLNSSTVTVVDDTKLINDMPREQIMKVQTKMPQASRRRTFDLGDTVTRTITMTNGCMFLSCWDLCAALTTYTVYETMHDQGRVKVAIHEPIVESPPTSPQFAGRTPLHFSHSKKKCAYEILPKTSVHPSVPEKEAQKDNVVLTSNIPLRSPFSSHVPIKLDEREAEYRECFRLTSIVAVLNLAYRMLIITRSLFTSQYCSSRY